MINKLSAGDEIWVAAGWYSPQWEEASVLSGGNCCYVVIGAGLTSATVLDCFFVTGGNANGSANITVNGYNVTSRLPLKTQPVMRHGRCG